MNLDESATAEVLSELDESGNVYLRLSTEASIDGFADDLMYETWEVEAYIYDSSDQHPDSNEEARIMVGVATALVLDYGWDGDAIAQNLDDHSQYYADIGKMLNPADRPGISDLFNEYDEETMDQDSSGLLIIPSVVIKPKWRGHRLSVEVVDVIGRSVGRHCAFTVIDPRVYTEDGRDEAATRKLVAVVEAAGFTRWYATPLFIRSNMEGVVMDSLAEPEVIAPIRHELNYGALVVSPQLTGSRDHITEVGVNVPDRTRTDDIPCPSGLGRFQLTPPEPGSHTTSIMLSFPESGVLFSVAAGANGEPVVTGVPDPETLAAVSPWAIALFEDCRDVAAEVRRAVRVSVGCWLQGTAPLPPAAGQLVVDCPWLPQRTLTSTPIRDGVATADHAGSTGGRTDVSWSQAGQPPVAVGAYFVEGASVIAEIRHDLGWTDADVDAVVRWMWAEAEAELSAELIAVAIVNAVYTRLAGPQP